MFKRLWDFLFSTEVPQQLKNQTPRDVASPMDQGDYHSGPHGYSPNTAYPETQYGSNFDEEADWNDH